MAYEMILTEIKDRVALISLNRPQNLNAINRQLTEELLAALTLYDNDPNIGALVLTGNDKAFAAGVDIREMQDQNSFSMYMEDWFAAWHQLTRLRTPLIAAVAGFALGGGCELAMMCDFIFAADTAKFGQPEIKLGIMPGMGGSQRLARLVGRAKAMELCLTGRIIDANEAEKIGLVARIVKADHLLNEAMESAQLIANMSLAASMAIKESINMADEAPLNAGLLTERRLFGALFAFNDHKEGLKAFHEKRPGKFNQSQS